VSSARRCRRTAAGVRATVAGRAGPGRRPVGSVVQALRCAPAGVPQSTCRRAPVSRLQQEPRLAADAGPVVAADAADAVTADTETVPLSVATEVQHRRVLF